MERRLKNLSLPVLLLVMMLMALVAGCSEKTFSEPMTFAGQEVPADTLNLGKDTYQLYCRACHGINGDGKGPAYKGLRPPPRDFRKGTYKFVAVESGYLPTDEDFRRIVNHGLNGTAM